MTGRSTTLALVLGLAGTMALADQAKPRGSSGSGSSSSGSSSSGSSHSGSSGVRQHSPSGGSSATHASSSDHSSRGSFSSREGLTLAERRHPRAGTGRGAFGPYSYYPGYGYWYSPGYYPGYYYGYYPYWGGGLSYGSGGYYGYYGGGYGGYYGGGYGSPYVYHSYHQSDTGALRLLVDPEDTKVYVDGYYAGEVDDFDGLLQRLYVAPGRHELTLKKDGYRSHRLKVYVGEDSTVKVRYDMEKGSGPDTMEDLAGERGLYEERRREARREDAEDRDEERDERDQATEPPPQPRARERELPPASAPVPPPGAGESRSPGLLVLDVSPNDASVYVDGRFVGNARQTGELELAPGPHRVEIVRPGFGTAEREITVEAGRTKRLEVSLRRP